MTGAVLAASAATRVAAHGQHSSQGHVVSGPFNFPHYAADYKGLFTKHGLTVELLYTPNSTVQREGLAAGITRSQTAADNSVAMVEVAKADAIIVTGGDSGFNRIIVQPEINSLADLRGKTVAVDAPNTAYALLLYKALKVARP
jgi:ABC-type nitrate/sulfonate/bicarbonate transport system substrate-binding protein